MNLKPNRNFYENMTLFYEYIPIIKRYHELNLWNTVGEPGFACALISADPAAQQSCDKGFGEPTEQDDKGGEEWVNI